MSSKKNKKRIITASIIGISMFAIGSGVGVATSGVSSMAANRQSTPPVEKQGGEVGSVSSSAVKRSSKRISSSSSAQSSLSSVSSSSESSRAVSSSSLSSSSSSESSQASSGSNNHDTSSVSTTGMPETAAVRTSYTVQAGDTLNIISAKLKISVNDLISMNHIVNMDHIEIGQVLTLH